ncbi:MAG: DUF4118 domain-containing protein [Chloroflexi bacterium]|nr:DUF4118 domain-containing protein [Chloroflexota bacterium]
MRRTRVRRTRVLSRTRAAWPYVVAVATSACALAGSLLAGGGGDIPPLLSWGRWRSPPGTGACGPGLLATALGFLALDYFFELPPNSLAVSDPRTVVDLLTFTVIAGLLGSLNAQLRMAQRRTEVALSEAEAAVRARDEALTAVSHDMRTPSIAIRATVAALQESDGSRPGAHAGSYCQILGPKVNGSSTLLATPSPWVASRRGSSRTARQMRRTKSSRPFSTDTCQC